MTHLRKMMLEELERRNYAHPTLPPHFPRCVVDAEALSAVPVRALVILPQDAIIENAINSDAGNGWRLPDR
jgi:hypothetical protein